MQPITWHFEGLNADDVIAIIRWQNGTDIPESLARLMVIAQGCTETTLDPREFANILPAFVDAVLEHMVEQARARYERIRDKPP
jgi:hypothetical protein